MRKLGEGEKEQAMSNIYPERNMFGFANYCRLVRDETRYWVEWVNVSDGDDEVVTALTAAATPQAAVAFAHEVIADMRRQIEQSVYYRDDDDGGIVQFRYDGYDSTIYLKVLHPGNADSLYQMVANLDLLDDRPESILQELCHETVTEWETHMKNLPELTNMRWMLLY
jgi:hypothetical protein